MKIGKILSRSSEINEVLCYGSFPEIVDYPILKAFIEVFKPIVIKNSLKTLSQ